MESIRLLLKMGHPERRSRHELSHFLDALSLYLEAGFDLAYAWPQAYLDLQSQLVDRLRVVLRPVPGEPVSCLLGRLATQYPVRTHRLWFGVLRELYERGAGMRDAVEAVARTLRAEHERELDSHCQRLPTRTNVVLLLFFLPPTLLLLFAPLIGEIMRSF